MSATAQALQPVVDVVPMSVDLDNFSLRCWARAYLAAHGMMHLQDAVDALQDFAVATGLVETLGQDAVQAIMAKAFSPPEAAR